MIAPGRREEIGSPIRYRLLVATLLLGLGILLFRLFQLQILQSERFRSLSEGQSVRASAVVPPRGMLFDRNGEPLVLNEIAFTLAIYPALFPDSLIAPFAQLLGTTPEAFAQQLKKYRRQSPFSPTKLLRDIPFPLAAFIQEHADQLPGVAILTEMKRDYPSKAKAAHVLGYIREINPQQLRQYEGNVYQRGDLIGYAGLEKSYEAFLRGKKGVEYLTVDALGQVVSHFNEQKNDIPSRQGFDLILSLDAQLQAVAESLLVNKQGALVAMDPRTGEILALASAPDYDLSVFGGRVDPQVYRTLIQDPRNPLLNRATRGRYPPGSVWKMLVALAGLQEGLITPATPFQCTGGVQFGTRFFKCHGAHGPVHIREAIQFSCNSYFYHLGLRLGADRIARYAKLFGFGQPTGIDIPESSGFVPTTQWYDRRYKHWTKALFLNLGIGQGEILVTPIQVAAYTAAIANRGIWRQPHLVRMLRDRETGQQHPIEFAERQVPIDQRWFDAVIDGMDAVVNAPGGTATNGALPGIRVCGKTGTAQNPHGRDHSWFTCFAPRENPEIVVTVIVENAGFGSTAAVPIARAFLKRYFHIPDHLMAAADSTRSAAQ